MGYSTITKGVQTYEKKGRKVIAPTPTGIPSALLAAIKEQRPPNMTEIINEFKCKVGTGLLSLDHADDIHRYASSLAHLAKVAVSISNLEKIEEISDEVLKSMTSDELKQYILKFIN
jgi:hypothetical protein